MEKEKTVFGSDVTRSLTMDSLRCFEAMELGNGWKILTSSDQYQHHAVWCNDANRSLVTFCEGDVVKIESPDETTYDLEMQHQINFYIGQNQ